MARKTSTSTAETEAAESKSGRTRARLLDATAKVLSRRGFAGTRLSDIAEEANVQAPAVYYYYSSREDLIEDVMYAGAASMKAYLLERLEELPASLPPADRLAVAVDAHLRYELDQSHFARALIRNANQVPEQLGRRALQEITDYNDIWRGLVDDLARAGQLRASVDATIGRMIILGALNWTVEWWDSEKGPIDGVIAVAQSMVLHALRP